MFEQTAASNLNQLKVSCDLCKHWYAYMKWKVSSMVIFYTSILSAIVEIPIELSFSGYFGSASNSL